MKTMETLVKLLDKRTRLWKGTFAPADTAERIDQAIEIAVTNLRESVAKHAAYDEAVIMEYDNWVPACGGTEEPITLKNGRRVLYVWNPARQKHAFLDLDRDMLISDREYMDGSR